MKSDSIFERIKIGLKLLFQSSDKQGIHISYKKRKSRNEILNWYREHPTTDKAIIDALAYLKSYGFISNYPYPFREKYSCKDICIKQDENGFLYYTFQDNKRLYLRNNTLKATRRMVRSLLTEQDECSPHQYMSDFMQISEGEVIADVGCAEAFLALQYIEKARHIYLFECDDSWIEALRKTFAPWSHKVTIVKKYVSDTNSDQTIRLDTFFKDKPIKPTFIKLDIEGAETAALRGLGSMLDTNLKLDVCTYHLQNDYQNVCSILEQHGYSMERSMNYMIAPTDGLKPPYFRVGLVRAKKIP